MTQEAIEHEYQRELGAHSARGEYPPCRRSPGLGAIWDADGPASRTNESAAPDESAAPGGCTSLVLLR
jgi:hypothetical protein